MVSVTLPIRIALPTLICMLLGYSVNFHAASSPNRYDHIHYNGHMLSHGYMVCRFALATLLTSMIHPQM